MNRKGLMTLISLFAFLPWALALEVGEPLEVGAPIEDFGASLDLDEGQRLQIFIVEQNLVAYFVDAENMVMESPAESIVFEVDHAGRRTDNWRTVLTASEGASLKSNRILPPPYHLKVRVIIRFTDGSTKTFARAFLNLNRNIE